MKFITLSVHRCLQHVCRVAARRAVTSIRQLILANTPMGCGYVLYYIGRMLLHTVVYARFLCVFNARSVIKHSVLSTGTKFPACRQLDGLRPTEMVAKEWS